MRSFVRNFQIQMLVFILCLSFFPGCKQYSLAKEMPTLQKKINTLHPGAKIDLEYTSRSSDPNITDSLTITISNTPTKTYSVLAHKTAWTLKSSSSVVASLKSIRIVYRFPGKAVPRNAEKPFVYSLATIQSPKGKKKLKN